MFLSISCYVHDARHHLATTSCAVSQIRRGRLGDEPQDSEVPNSIIFLVSVPIFGYSFAALAPAPRAPPSSWLTVQGPSHLSSITNFAFLATRVMAGGLRSRAAAVFRKSRTNHRSHASAAFIACEYALCCALRLNAPIHLPYITCQLPGKTRVT